MVEKYGLNKKQARKLLKLNKKVESYDVELQKILTAEQYATYKKNRQDRMPKDGMRQG